MDAAHPDMTDGAENGFDRWASIAGVVYFAILAAPAVLLKNVGLGALWFRTALPVTYVAGAALTWLFWPAPRPAREALAWMFTERARKRPSITILFVGALISIETWALTVPLTVPAAERSLPPFEIALTAIAVVAVVGGYVLRRVWAARR